MANRREKAPDLCGSGASELSNGAENWVLRWHICFMARPMHPSAGVLGAVGDQFCMAEKMLLVIQHQMMYKNRKSSYQGVPNATIDHSARRP
jgi:hypothetical protein